MSEPNQTESKREETPSYNRRSSHRAHLTSRCSNEQRVRSMRWKKEEEEKKRSRNRERARN